MRIKRGSWLKMKVNDVLKRNDGINTEKKKLALMQVLSLSSAEVSLHLDKNLSFYNYIKYLFIVKRLVKGVPIQYISHKAYFYNRWFRVNKHTLIPRVETEYLVNDAKMIIDKYFSSSVKILDIGTGSGVIAITLAESSDKYFVTATDISRKALKVAKSNDNKSLVKFVHTDLYSSIDDKFDVVISNPPYIRNDSLLVSPEVLKYEPHFALYGGDDGLLFYRRIFSDIKRIVNDRNIICFETGEEQNDLIEEIALGYFPNAKIIKKNDLNGFNRYIFIINE